MVKAIVLLLFITGLRETGSAVELRSTPIQSEFSRVSYWLQPEDEFDVKSSNGEPDLRTKRRSPTKAALLSAALPGLGEHYLGDRKTARYFFAAEGVIWVSFIAFTRYSDIKRDDYFALAASRANTNLEGKSEAFIDAVGFYDTVEEYNTAGRIIEPERPYYNPLEPSTYWRWEDPRDRETYRGLKNRSEEAGRRADFAIGAAVLNRMVSVIHTYLKARRLQRSDDDFSLLERMNIEFSAPLLGNERVVTVSYRFGG